MKYLIAVTTCKWRAQNANYQRMTWVQDSPVDVRFFVGSELVSEDGDTVHLNCNDSYRGLPAKVQETCRWALEHDYDYLLKADDDVYVRPERVLHLTDDYIGLKRDPYWEAPKGFCAGFAYGMSRKAFEIIANAGTPNLDVEDRWVANTLASSGIEGKNDPRFIMTLGRFQNGRETPTAFNNVIASAEHSDVRIPHITWLKSVKMEEDLCKKILL